jgi:hypothetical protein
MTETDLRFAFHMDTGNFPMWSYDYWMEKVLNHGHPTSEYGQWLEEHTGNSRAGNPRWLQRAYQFQNQSAPVYRSEGKSYYRSGRRRSYQWIIRNVYDAAYCYWLEQRILDKHPEVIKNILHI